MINDLKKQAETAKKIPKQKVNKKKAVATPPPQPEKKEAGEGEEKSVPAKRGERGGRRGGRGDGRPRGPPREQRQGAEVDGAAPREDRPRRGGGRGGGVVAVADVAMANDAPLIENRVIPKRRIRAIKSD